MPTNACCDSWWPIDMSIALLDINDSNLQLWSAGQALQSPAYALLENNQYLFGNTARAAARLHPRQINTRFWWQLNTQPLQPALGPARHTADLVHAHLLDIHDQAGKPGELLLSVSSSLQRDQLALLLGIIQQCPFEAVGLVNRSVVIGSLYGGPGKLFHLEIQLHQALLSELAESSGQVELVRSVPLPGCGLLQLQERLVENIASAFIRQTRFDPRRKANTEQLLYDALPGMLVELKNHSEANMEVNGYRARIVRKELEAAGSRLFNSAPEAMGILSASDRVLLDPLASLLPGIGEQIPQAEFIAVDALPEALNLHMDNLVQRDETLNFITALPCLSQPIQPQPADVVAPPPPVQNHRGPLPSHILQGASATALAEHGSLIDADLSLEYTAGQWVLSGTASGASRVNGDHYLPGTALFAGDTISTPSGTTVTLIEVKP
jgi:hypothetical protein